MKILCPTSSFSKLQVERLEVGALVTIRGIGRVKIIELLQASDKWIDSHSQVILLTSEYIKSIMLILWSF